MKNSRTATTQAPAPSPVQAQRSTDRIPASFGLMYSGVTDGGVIMGDGTVVDLSSNGFGVRGNQAVTTGMDLTLFLYLPDQEDPLFIIQARVAWARGHRFGLHIHDMCTRERQRLQAFLHDHSRRTASHQLS